MYKRQLPVGPLQALASFGGEEIREPVKGLDAPVDTNRVALIGDIVLTYTFPDYTGLKPLTVRNSDGTIHAPADTVVDISLRTQDTYEGAFLQINEGEEQPVELRQGRTLNATITIKEEGYWRALFLEQGSKIPSPDLRIEFDADDPPVVTLNACLLYTSPSPRD